MHSVNIIKEQMLSIQTPEVIRASQAFLASLRKVRAPIRSWTSGIDRETMNVMFSIPSVSLESGRSRVFLKVLRESWMQSGFNISEEFENIGYQCNNDGVYCHIFILENCYN